ncbi:MAG: restriction endonuclease subunit S [Deferribacteraceae bacterium]|nr:restriction endonuclease subunit S [Deferribacteraceae bacterium]
MANVPDIRFKGFTDAWEQRKIGEIANFNPRSVLPDEFVYVDLESVVGTSLISSRIERKETAPLRAQRLAQKGDIFFQMVRPYQMNNYLYDLLHENYVFSTGYAQLRPKIHSHFLMCVLQDEKFVANVIDRCTGTSYPAIKSTDLAEIEVYITSDKEEQTTIGNFFRTLDTTITTYKRKLDGLRKLKKAYLQQMFPKTGESAPKIRFAGFTGEWEQRKLGKMGEFKNGMNFEKNALGHGYPFVNLLDVFGTNVVKSENLGLALSNEKQRNDYSLCKSDVLFIRSSVKPEGVGEAAVVLDDIPNATYSGFMIRFRPNLDMDVKFERYIFSTLNIRSQIMKGATSSANTNINQTALSSILVSFPSKSEQTAIGNFFHILDKQIENLATKLEQIKKLKSAYLRKMFV